MNEKKEGLLVKINTAFKKVVDDLFDGLDKKTAMDFGAIGFFVLGAILLGIGIQFSTAIFIVPGVAMLILGFIRFLWNVTDGFA